MKQRGVVLYQRAALERKYRRRLRLFPRSWRSNNEEELLGVLLEGAEPDQVSVPMRESLNLLSSVLQIRVARFRRARNTGSAIGSAVLIVALIVAGVVFTTSVPAVSSGFLVTSLVVILLPGTGVVYTVSNAIGGGVARGTAAAFGCTLGIIPHLMAAMFGLSGVMQAGATAFEVVRWIGVGYLLFMGLSMIRGGGKLSLSDDNAQQQSGTMTVIRRGIVLNLLNPKLTVFFFAFLPQFLDATPRPLDPMLVILGLIFMAMTFIVFLGYARVGLALRSKVLESPKVLRRIERSLGTLLVGFAARLALTDR